MVLPIHHHGAVLTDAEIAYFIAGAATNTIPEYQLAAWLMAVVWRGLNPAELHSLTTHMRDSGRVLRDLVRGWGPNVIDLEEPTRRSSVPGRSAGHWVNGRAARSYAPRRQNGCGQGQGQYARGESIRKIRFRPMYPGFLHGVHQHTRVRL